MYHYFLQPGLKNLRTLILIKPQQHHFLSICSVFSELFFSCLLLFSFVSQQQYKITTAAAASFSFKRSKTIHQRRKQNREQQTHCARHTQYKLWQYCRTTTTTPYQPQLANCIADSLIQETVSNKNAMYVTLFEYCRVWHLHSSNTVVWRYYGITVCATVLYGNSSVLISSSIVRVSDIFEATSFVVLPFCLGKNWTIRSISNTEGGIH